MSSPFSTIEEFNNAIDGPTGGAIYTFAHSPAINNIALIIAVGLFIWFIFKTYAVSHKTPAFDKSLNHLSVFIIAGLLSLVAADHWRPSRSEQSAHISPEARVYPSSAKSAGVLGMVGLGIPALGRGRRRVARPSATRPSSGVKRSRG